MMALVTALLLSLDPMDRQPTEVTTIAHSVAPLCMAEVVIMEQAVGTSNV